MIWQDIVIAVANVLFGYSLIYQVYYGIKKKKGFLTFQASIPTTIGLYALSFSFWTLELYVSTVISFFNGSMWFLLFVQRLVFKKA